MRVYADRVGEISVTTGTDNFALGGAALGYQTFAGVMNVGDTCDYAALAIDGNGNPSGAWETGTGTFGAGDVLDRAVQQSSNGNALVNFPAGNKLIIMSENAASILALVAGGGGGGGGGGSNLLMEIVLGADTQHIDLTDIPAGHGDLRMTIFGRCDYGDNDAPVYITFNADTGGNYYGAQYFGNGGGQNTSQGANSFRGPQIAGNAAPAGTFDFLDFNIGNYDVAGAQKAFHGKGANYSSDGDRTRLLEYVGRWVGTDPISAIHLVMYQNANFKAGTTVRLYGSK